MFATDLVMNADLPAILALLLIAILILPAHIVVKRERTGWTLKFERKPSKNSLLLLLIQSTVRFFARQ